MSKTLINIGIEKSGSDTFRDIFLPQFDDDEIFWIVRSRDFEKRREELFKMDPMQSRKIKFVTGHMFFGLHEAFMQECLYLTMLRNPVDRLLSCYMSYRRKPNSPLHEIANDMTFHRFIESERKLHVNNHMVRYLYGWNGANQPKYWEIGEKHFEIAQRHLIDHCLWGITELYDDSLIYFYNQIGGKYPLYTRANFAKEAKPFISEETRKLIYEHNEWDWKLYYWAKKVFAETINTDEHRRQMRTFKLLNGTIGRFKIGRRLKRLINRGKHDAAATVIAQETNTLLFNEAGQYQG